MPRKSPQMKKTGKKTADAAERDKFMVNTEMRSFFLLKNSDK